MPRIQLNDIELHYTSTGEGDPVLLLHGLGSSVDDWELQVPALAKSHRVVAVDLRGHGKSDKPSEPYSMALFASDVRNVIRFLRLGPVHVVGISMGGAVAFELAASAPETVRSLTIVNSGPEAIPRTFAQRAGIKMRFAMLRLFGLPTLAKVVAKKLFPKPEQAAERATFIERCTKNDPAAYKSALRAIVGWSVKSRLQDIACPILVVTGDRDYTPVSIKEEYMPLLRDARLEVIRDSGHFTSFDQPARLNELLLGFFAEQARGENAASSASCAEVCS